MAVLSELSGIESKPLQTPQYPSSLVLSELSGIESWKKGDKPPYAYSIRFIWTKWDRKQLAEAVVEVIKKCFIWTKWDRKWIALSLDISSSGSFIWTKWDKKVQVFWQRKLESFVLSELSGIERLEERVFPARLPQVLSELSGIETYYPS